MSRLALASIATAAVLGTAGGIGYAVTSADDDPPARDVPAAGPLYFLHGTIHDGATEIEVADARLDADLVAAVERDGDGYVLVSSDDTSELSAVHVAADGSTRPVDVPPDPDRRVLTGADHGPAAWAPRSPSGELLLTGTVVDDGPPPSELQVRDRASDEVVHRFDPGGYRLAAAWGADDDTVYVVTGSDGTAKLALNRCKVAAGTCTALLEAEGNLVLGRAS